MEGLISKMRNIHKSTAPSFRRRENAAAIVKAPPPPGALTKGPDRKFPGLHPPLGGATSPSFSLNRRFAFPILALLAALAVGLLFLLPGGTLQAQSSDGTIMYPENGTGAVATYTAMDPELTDIVSWSLDGTDAGDFDISAGVLTFKKSPDFEMPGDVPGTDPSTVAANDNIYEVTVQATDETSKTGTKEVMVEVTNVDEMGTVTLSALRPQSATMFTATLTDPDGDMTSTTWQWSKASSRNGSYTDIEDATSDMSPTRRLTLTLAPTCVRRRATLTKRVPARVRWKGRHIRCRRSGARTKPPSSLTRTLILPRTDDTATREVPENTPAGMAIGDPVVAEDGNGDILTYTLTGD